MRSESESDAQKQKGVKLGVGTQRSNQSQSSSSRNMGRVSKVNKALDLQSQVKNISSINFTSEDHKKIPETIPEEQTPKYNSEKLVF